MLLHERKVQRFYVLRNSERAKYRKILKEVMTYWSLFLNSVCEFNFEVMVEACGVNS